MTPRRQLIVMRHAKAGELPGGPDIERALRPRGCRNATAAGRWLASRGDVPDLVLCSTARRSRQTWEYVSAELAGSPAVVDDPRLYQADADDLLGIIAESAPDLRSVMYVGHNPAAADLTEILVGRPVDFPTAGTAILGLAAPWQDLAAGAADGTCELIATWTPKADVG